MKDKLIKIRNEITEMRKKEQSNDRLLLGINKLTQALVVIEEDIDYALMSLNHTKPTGLNSYYY